MEPTHFDVPWATVANWAVAGAVGMFLWVLKQFGMRHLQTIEDLVNEIKEMRKELSKLTERVSRVELRQEYIAEHDRDKYGGV